MPLLCIISNIYNISYEIYKLFPTHIHLSVIGCCLKSVFPCNMKSFCFVLRFYDPVNNEVMSSRPVNSGTDPGQA